MDRKFRKQIKDDPFRREFEHTVSWLDQNKEALIRYGGIGLAALALGFGIYFFIGHQATVRADALNHALLVDDATVGPAPSKPGGLAFPTQADKDKARGQAFSEVASKYHGDAEGAVAQMQLASDAADKGDFATAERTYNDIVNSAPKEYGAMAKLALANIYAGENKDADAEKLLRDLMAHPTLTVSKDEAAIHLAKLIARNKSGCEEARKLLDPMRTERTAISRAAVTTLSQLSTCQGM
ncbi:MAG TPA: tetratricopeptide repeat protein [Bryobacteraceae bacterium]|nr:tetratricopeptide repeat protein [Bryobacteraceae bacterium]